jgi:hypothetical protein
MDWVKANENKNSTMANSEIQIDCHGLVLLIRWDEASARSKRTVAQNRNRPLKYPDPWSNDFTIGSARSPTIEEIWTVLGCVTIGFTVWKGVSPNAWLIRCEMEARFQTGELSPLVAAPGPLSECKQDRSCYQSCV